MASQVPAEVQVKEAAAGDEMVSSQTREARVAVSLEKETIFLSVCV